MEANSVFDAKLLAALFKECVMPLIGQGFAFGASTATALSLLGYGVFKAVGLLSIKE